MKINDCAGPVFSSNGVGGGGSVITAGFRRFRSQVLPSSTAIIYVRTTGSDSNDGTTPATAFLTVNRAVQETVWDSQYEGATARQIDVGAGDFIMPDSVLGSGSLRLTGATTLTFTATVDATTPAVNATVGNRLVLIVTGMGAVVADALIGQLLYFPVQGVYARIYKNDATVVGPPDLLTVWVVTESDTPNDIPAVGEDVEFYSIDTNLQVTNSGCTFSGGSHYYASLFEFVNWEPDPASTGFDIIDVIGAIFVSQYSNFDLTLMFNGAGSEHQLRCCWQRCNFWQYVDSGSIEYVGGNVIDLAGAAGSPATWGNGAISAIYENAAVRIGGTAPVFALNGGQFYSDTQALSGAAAASFSTMRLNAVPSAFHANYAADFTIGQGGEYRLPSFLPPYTVGGAQIAGTVTTVLVDVASLSHANVTLGANSSITIGGTVNPVRIGGVAGSADASGTRIVGGLPLPGSDSASQQLVTATAQTWNGLTRTVILDSSAIGGGGTFLLPAGATITPGARVVIKNIDGTNSVAITPNGTDQIDEVNAAVPTGATRAAIGLELQVLAGPVYNWMVGF